MRRTHTTAKMVVLLCLVPALVAVTGCGFISPEVSAITKVAMGQMDKLSGGEIQAVAATFAPDVELNEEQADAVAEFLAGNEIKTIADLQALIDQAMQDPTSVELPEGFLDLFEGMDFSGIVPPEGLA